MEKSNNSQNVLKSLLIVQTFGLLVYTMYVGANDGFIFLQVAINNALSLTWNGQFALDFSCYLVLSGLWIMWRNKFAPASVVFAVVAMIMGIVVFAPYLLYLLNKENGNLKQVLLGDRS